MSEQQLDNLSLSFGGLHLSITTRPTSSSSSVTSHVGVPTTPFSSSWVERENFAFQQGQYYYSLLRGLELPTLPEIPVRPSLSCGTACTSHLRVFSFHPEVRVWEA